MYFVSNQKENAACLSCITKKPHFCDFLKLVAGTGFEPLRPRVNLYAVVAITIFVHINKNRPKTDQKDLSYSI